MSNEGRSNGANLVTPGRYALRVLLCVPVWIEYVILLEKLINMIRETATSIRSSVRSGGSLMLLI